MRATKIIATIGPATDSEAMISDLIDAGVNVFRLNFSHRTDHKQTVQNIRKISAEKQEAIAIMADLQGPKIRIGKFVNNKIQLKAGDPFLLDNQCTLGDNTQVGLDYKELPNDVKVGDRLLLNDGLIVLQVTSVAQHQIHTEVVIGGELSNHKGINKEGGGLSAPAITTKDMADIQTAIQYGVDYIAISFPKDVTDIALARQLINVAATEKRHSDEHFKEYRPKLIAKIERIEAIDNLDSITQASDGLMVARGDLAVEVGNAAVPALQKRMIKLSKKYNKLSITATQMMESMIHSPMPTRAEVSDVANAVLDGTDAVMLSAETAVGQFPIETVRSMAQICVAAEQSQSTGLTRDFIDQEFSRIDQSIANGALFIAHKLKAKAIIALTDSGATALWLSRQLSQLPIIALTPHEFSIRRMAMYRNVMPYYLAEETNHSREMISLLNFLLEKRLVSIGDTIVVTFGDILGQAGGTNALRVIQVYNPKANS